MAGATGGVGGMGRLSSEELAAWVAASCETQGLPVKVTDPEAVRQVWVLLGASESGPRLVRQHVRGSTRQGSEAPERTYPLRVQGARAGAAGFDDGVIENGPDNGVLPGEVEPGPLSA